MWVLHRGIFITRRWTCPSRSLDPPQVRGTKMNQHCKKQIFCPPGARRGKAVCVEHDPKNWISSTPCKSETSVCFTNGSPKPKTEPWMYQKQHCCLISLSATWTVGLSPPSASLPTTPSCVAWVTRWGEGMPDRGTWTGWRGGPAWTAW